LRTYRAVRETEDAKKAQRLIADALPSVAAAVLRPEELESMRQRLKQLPEPPSRARLNGKDWRGAVGVFLLVFLTTFPVAVPFIFLRDAETAMRLSNGVAIVMLFAAGFAYGRVVGRSPWGFGISMVVLGSILVSLTIALGG